jgi:hypothetical protein
MKRLSILSIALFLLILVILALVYCVSDSRFESGTERQCLNHEAPLIQGKRYGEEFRARVTIVKDDNSKDPQKVLQLLNMDDQILQEKTILPYSCLFDEKLEVGKTYSCEAYFSGSYVGTPSRAMQYCPVSDYSFHFRSYVELFNLREVYE